MTGKTAVDMPELPIATLQRSVLACSTGPGAGLTDISTRDTESYDRIVKGKWAGLRDGHVTSLCVVMCLIMWVWFKIIHY